LKTTLYLIRHGEVKNPKKVEYLRLPGFELSQKGRAQVLSLSKKIKDKKISLIYASPLLRAKETAEIISENIAKNKVPIRYSNKLLEADYKKWQGLKMSEVDKKEIEKLHKNPVRYSATLGESLSCIQKRVVEDIFEIAKKNRGKNIAVVFHADPIIAARLFFEKKSFDDYKRMEVRYASVTSIILDDTLECEKVEYKEYIR